MLSNTAGYDSSQDFSDAGIKNGAVSVRLRRAFRIAVYAATGC